MEHTKACYSTTALAHLWDRWQVKVFIILETHNTRTQRISEYNTANSTPVILEALFFWGILTLFQSNF